MSPKKTPSPKKPADVKVPIDAKLKKRWDQLSAVINESSGKGASAFDALWEAVGEVVNHDPPLYVAGGYGSAAEFFREVLHETERTARRNIRVARFASPKEEATYGTALLDAALGFLEAKAGKALDGSLPVDFSRLKIPVKRDGGPAAVPLAEATVVEVAAATRGVLAKKGTSRAKQSSTEKALAASLAKVKSLAGVTVHDHAGLLTFQRVPTGALGVFGKTVAAHRGDG